MGEPARALSLTQQTLDAFQRLAESWGELGAIVEIAACGVDLSEPQVAARLRGAADALARATGAVRIPPWLYEQEYARDGARGLLGDATYLAGVEAGLRMSTAEALDYARRFAATHVAQPMTTEPRPTLAVD